MSDLARDGKANFTIGGAKPPVAPVAPENLDELEAQLRASLAEVARKRDEIRRIEQARIADEKANRHIVVSVKDFAGGMVITHSDYRDDLLATWQLSRKRMFRGNGENAIPVGDWAIVLASLTTLPKLDIIYRPGVEEAIHKHLYAPVWEISLDQRVIKATPGPRYFASDLAQVPGIEWKNQQGGFFTVPMSEAWRLYEALKNVEGVVYSEEAREFTIKQVEQRAMLDQIGVATDWEYDPGFANGHTLRPFQRVGCAFVEATGGRALLAYEMGLGKTPMSIAYAWKNKFRTVIVAPASLKANWARQIFKFTGINPVVLTGAEPLKHDLITMLTSPSPFTIINYDILGRLTEYDDVKKDTEGFDHVEHKRKFLWVEAINMSRPDLIIFDESHYIKNTDSNRSQAAREMKAPHILHMTGTPVLNRPGELWPMLTMLDPATFPAEQTFISQYTVNDKKVMNVDKLKEALKTTMIRRKHSDVRKDMPPKNRITEYHDLSPKARKLYLKILQGVYERIEAYNASGKHGGEDGIANILVQIQRLKQVCAIDKVDRTAELATELHESASEERHNKVLIFSQFKATTYAIAQRLGHEALSFVSRGKSDFVTASNEKRDRLVQQFQTDPKIKYLVVTEHTAKEGHDITEAGFVIFNDLFWTPASHDQGEGRAYMREIDPHGITSYYLITDKESGEIEEWVWELLGLKTDVINQTVEGVEGARDVSIAMALIERMRETMWSRGKGGGR